MAAEIEISSTRMAEVLRIDVVTDDTTVNCVVLDEVEWLEIPVSLRHGFSRTGLWGRAALPSNGPLPK